MTVTSDAAATLVGRTVRMIRVFEAPRALVFRSLIEPAHLVRWWGPRGWTTPRCEFEAREGSPIRIDMQSPEGTLFVNAGVIREVTSPARFVFTLGAFFDDAGQPSLEVLNTMTLAEHAGRTTLTLLAEVLHATPQVSPAVDAMVAGWNQALDRMAEGLANGTDIVITRLLDAPRELVWEAFTNPKHVVNWWGPTGFRNTLKEMQVRPGGVWRHIMHGPDGTDYPNKAVYVEVVKPERLSYDLSDDSKDAKAFRATVDFADEDGRTRLTLRLHFGTAAERDQKVKDVGAIEGGNQTLDRLAAYLKTM